MKRLISLAVAMLTVSAYGQIPEPRTLELSDPSATSLRVYQANVKTYSWTVLRNGSPQNLTGYTPFMWIAPSNTSAGIVTAQCAIVTASNGTFTASFSAVNLNATGSWVYGVGVSSNGVGTMREGNIVLTPDPLAAGAGAQVMTTNLNWNLFTFSGTSPWTASIVAATNSLDTLTWSRDYPRSNPSNYIVAAGVPAAETDGLSLHIGGGNSMATNIDANGFGITKLARIFRNIAGDLRDVYRDDGAGSANDNVWFDGAQAGSKTSIVVSARTAYDANGAKVMDWSNTGPRLYVSGYMGANISVQTLNDGTPTETATLNWNPNILTLYGNWTCDGTLNATNGVLSFGQAVLTVTAGKTVTHAWIDASGITQSQAFVAGQLTLWKTNGVDIP